MDKIKVLVCGCNGHMGQIVCRLIEESEDMEVLCGIDTTESPTSNFPVLNAVTALEALYQTPDIIIDFSHADCSMDVLFNFACEKNIPMVIATTGFSDNQLSIMQKCSEETMVFLSSNMSYQVNLVAEILKEIAPKLADYDIEIVETHHNRKKDAPSGTAKTLAESINSSLDNRMEIVYGREGKRESNEIGVSALRGGNIVGTHTINFFGESDSLTITHTALSRDMFAEGAIKAAKYILECKEQGITHGLFSMKDLM